MKQTMTLTEALVKLKLYERKINKKLRSDMQEMVIDYTVGDKKGRVSGLTEEELKNKANSVIQQTQALINNRNKLKAAVAQTNAITTVKVGDKEYTIVQAIERKNGIVKEKEFIGILEKQVNYVNQKVQSLNTEAREKANDIVEAQVSAEAKNKKTEEVEKLYELIYNKNKAEIIDPVGIEALVEKLKNDVEEFEQNVDVALSIANAKTEIEVDFDEE